jgi:hypothetical protein
MNRLASVSAVISFAGLLLSCAKAPESTAFSESIESAQWHFEEGSRKFDLSFSFQDPEKTGAEGKPTVRHVHFKGAVLPSGPDKRECGLTYEGAGEPDIDFCPRCEDEFCASAQMEIRKRGGPLEGRAVLHRIGVTNAKLLQSNQSLTTAEAAGTLIARVSRALERGSKTVSLSVSEVVGGKSFFHLVAFLKPSPSDVPDDTIPNLQTAVLSGEIASKTKLSFALHGTGENGLWQGVMSEPVPGEAALDAARSVVQVKVKGLVLSVGADPVLPK